jgi:hypothetical protein
MDMDGTTLHFLHGRLQDRYLGHISALFSSLTRVHLKMPKMSLLEVEKEYVFVLKKFETNCTYDIYDGNTFEHLSSAWTLQMPPNEGPRYVFSWMYMIPYILLLVITLHCIMVVMKLQ